MPNFSKALILTLLTPLALLANQHALRGHGSGSQITGPALPSSTDPLVLVDEAQQGPRLSSSVFHSFGADIDGPGLPSSEGRELCVTRAVVDLDAGYPFNDENYLLFGIGYKVFALDWSPNPQHEDDVFHNAGANLGLFTMAMENWNWTAVVGFSSNLTNGNFCNATQYNGLLWGQYNWREDLGFHIGAVGRGGIEDWMILPILGIEWTPEGPWSIALIIPVKTEVRYTFNPQWSLATRLRYVSERNRFKGDEANPSGIFEYILIGGELELTFRSDNPHVELSLSAGYSGFQELEVYDHRGKNKSTYDVDNGFFIGFQGKIEFPIGKGKKA